MRKNCFYIVVMLCFAKISFASDSLRQANDVAAHGSKFQAERLKVIAENLANEATTGETPGSDPYRRKVIFAKNIYNKDLGTKVIITKKVATDDKSDFIYRYEPSHPAADENGMVKYPNVHKEIEKADMSEAQRSYEANLSVMEITNSLTQKTIEAIGR